MGFDYLVGPEHVSFAGKVHDGIAMHWLGRVLSKTIGIAARRQKHSAPCA
ncbi:MAG: hypothetical protein ACI965_000248 [Paraglaciecola sp.]|jgi:hypothetical protein